MCNKKSAVNYNFCLLMNYKLNKNTLLQSYYSHSKRYFHVTLNNCLGKICTDTLGQETEDIKKSF